MSSLAKDQGFVFCPATQIYPHTFVYRYLGVAGVIISSKDCPLTADTNTFITTIPKDIIGILNYLDFGYSCTFLVISSSSTGLTLTRLSGSDAVQFTIVDGYNIYAKSQTGRNASKYNFVTIATRAY